MKRVFKKIGCILLLTVIFSSVSTIQAVNSKKAQAASLYGSRPLVGVVNYEGLKGVNKIFDELSLTPAKWNYRLPFYASVTNDSSRLVRTANNQQEIVYRSTTDITNIMVYAAFNDAESIDLANDIKIYESSDGTAYTLRTYGPGSARIINYATDWQKVNYQLGFDPGIKYVKIAICKTNGSTTNPQLMRTEILSYNSTGNDLVKLVDDYDDFSKMHSHTANLTFATNNPGNFLLVTADDNSQAVMDQQIAYANSAHIDYMAWLDMRTNWVMPTPTSVDLFRSSTNKGNLKYCVILGYLDGYETFDQMTDRIVSYLGESAYVKVLNGRPLIYLIDPSQWSVSDINILRNKSQAAGYGNPYIVGMTHHDYSAICDAGSGYASVSAGVTYNYAGTSHSIPLVSFGVHDGPRQDNPPSWGAWGPTEPEISGNALKQYVNTAIQWSLNNPAANEAQATLIYAWNEHAEAAANIEPTRNTDGTVNTANLDAVGEAIKSWEPVGPSSNLLSNPGFEAGTASWSGLTCSIAANSSAHSGSYACLAYDRGATWSSPAQDITNILLANGQGTYYGGVWAKFASSSDSMSLLLNTTDSGGSHWFSLGYSESVGTSYTQLSGSANITWTGTLSSAILYVQSNSSTENLYVDDFSLSRSGGSAPGSFSLSSPSNGATGVSTVPTFHWGSSSGAASYTLVVSPNSDLSSPVLHQAGITSTAYTPGTALSSGTVYYWRVTAVNASGSTGCSSNFSFTTASAANLLLNPGFESGTASWGAQTCSIAASASAHSGAYACLVYGREAAWGSPVQDIKNILLANGQGTYYGGVWAKFASGSDNLSIIVNTVDGEGSHWFNLGYAGIGTSYTQISGSANITWTGTLSSALLYVQSNSSTTDLYLDDFSLARE